MPRNPEEPVRVKQSEKDACDINKLMERYRNGGEIDHINRAQGQYGDFSSGQSFTDAYTAISKAENAFAVLPAHIRDKFGNNPEVFLYKMEDPKVQKEMSDLGVFDPEAGPIVEEPKSAPILDPEPTPRSTPLSGTPPENEAKPPQPDGKDSTAVSEREGRPAGR